MRSYCYGYSGFNQRAALYTVPHFPEESGGKPNEWLHNNLQSYYLVVHEFCHTLGITHCQHPKCAMNNAVFKTKLCDDCRRWAERELSVRPGGAEERFSLAESYLLNNHLTQAAAAYNEAIARAPREPLYYHSLSMVLYRLRQREEAEQNLMLAIEHSNDPGAYYACRLTCLRDTLPLLKNFLREPWPQPRIHEICAS